MSIANLKVSDLMTENVESIDAGANLDLADEMMRSKEIRHLPVLDGGKLVGLVTSRDVLRAKVSSVHSSLTEEQLQRAYQQIEIRTVMTKEMVTIEPGARASAAARVLRDRKIDCLPVIHEDALVGILTSSDFLEVFIQADEA